MKIFALIQTNCNSSLQGQRIKLSLHNSVEEAELVGEKDEDLDNVLFDGKMGWWNGKRQMFCYVDIFDFNFESKYMG